MSKLLSSILDIKKGDKVAVVGCWGKTSLIECLAYESIGRVAITPTTKMYPIEGLNVIGIPEANGKISSLPLDEIETLPYDIILMEADGSKGLPFKGYKNNEPVIPPFTTKTIAVINAQALKLPATVDNVHRLPEFLKQTGLQKGDTININAVSAMLKTMLQKKQGQTILLLNGVTNFENINYNNLKITDADIVIAGCTYKKNWRKLCVN